MPAKLLYYAHSAQDELSNLLPYEHWQTLQSHSVNVGEMRRSLLRYLVHRKLPARRDSCMIWGNIQKPLITDYMVAPQSITLLPAQKLQSNAGEMLSAS